ncbi:MAG: DUF4157 domain-containing protein [Ilumatobacter sp.]
MENRVRRERPVARRKLVVGAADDRFEREADRMARHVVTSMAASTSEPSSTVARQDLDEEELAMKRADASSATSKDPVRRAVVGPEGGELDASVASEIDGARGGGRPLEAGLRRSLEPAFGSDFSQVRMHTGPRADRLNTALGARAFTTGSDVFVRSSDYAPRSRAGQELIAHELTHVVQQGGARDLDDSR